MTTSSELTSDERRALRNIKSALKLDQAPWWEDAKILHESTNPDLKCLAAMLSLAQEANSIAWLLATRIPQRQIATPALQDWVDRLDSLLAEFDDLEYRENK